MMFSFVDVRVKPLLCLPDEGWLHATAGVDALSAADAQVLKPAGQDDHPTGEGLPLNLFLQGIHLHVGSHTSLS